MVKLKLAHFYARRWLVPKFLPRAQAVNDMVVGIVETDQEGGFSFTYKFVDTGSYEVKSSCEYYEKTLESPITTVTVKSPSLLTPELIAFVTGTVVAVAVGGYILVKRR